MCFITKKMKTLKHLPICGIIMTNRNVRPMQLLSQLRRPIAMPSPTGYTPSQITSKYNGFAAVSRKPHVVAEMYKLAAQREK